MSTREHDFTATRPGFAAAFFSASFGLVHKVYALIAAWMNRRTAGQYLLAMDERMLADIGLTRGDLRSAWSEPVWIDPTVRLQRIAAERRAARHGQRALRHEPPRPPVSAVNLRRENPGRENPGRENPGEARSAGRPKPRLQECGEAA